MVRIDIMEKQLDIIAEKKDMETFFRPSECLISDYLENCYIVTFLKESDITYGSMGFWECNGFELVGFSVNSNKQLTATIRVNKRRLSRGVVKEELVIQ